MKKTITSLSAVLTSSALTVTASAQTSDGNSAANLAGEVVAIVVVVVVVVFLVYAGYKMVKKWSGGGPS